MVCRGEIGELRQILWIRDIGRGFACAPSKRWRASGGLPALVM